jgi:hypothetical protein
MRFPALAMQKERSESQSQIALVSVAGSAGGSTATRELLAHLPADFPAPILYLQHLGASYVGSLPAVLQHHTRLKVCWAQQGDRLRSGAVYLCPPNHFFFVRPDGTLGLSPMSVRREALSAADLFFASVAETFAHRAVAVVLSGAGSDGAEGVRAVHDRGGPVLAQDEPSSYLWSMPKSAIATGCVDFVLSPGDMGPVLVSLVRDGRSLSMVRARAKVRSTSLGPELHYELDKLLQMMLAMQGTDLGNIQLVDRETESLVIVAQRGFGMDFLEHFRTVRMCDESACSRAMQARETVVIPDIDSDSLFAPHRDVAERAGFCAVQSTPLISADGNLQGVLSTHFRSRHRPSMGELRMLQLHGRRAGQTIEQLQAAPQAALLA